MKYNHVGIPTTAHFDGEIPLPHLNVTSRAKPAARERKQRVRNAPLTIQSFCVVD
jgi:hypothetical protein